MGASVLSMVFYGKLTFRRVYAGDVMMSSDELDFEAAARANDRDSEGATAQSVLAIFVTLPLVFLILVMASLAIFGKPGAAPTDGKKLAVTTVAGVEATSEGLTSTGPAQDFEKHSGFAPSPTALGLDSGVEISSMSLDGDRIAVEAGGEIILYDFRAGQVLQRLAVHGAGQTQVAAVNAASFSDNNASIQSASFDENSTAAESLASVPKRHQRFELTAPSLSPRR